jgi:hypothetical protein
LTRVDPWNPGPGPLAGSTSGPGLITMVHAEAWTQDAEAGKPCQDCWATILGAPFLKLLVVLPCILSFSHYNFCRYIWFLNLQWILFMLFNCMNLVSLPENLRIQMKSLTDFLCCYFMVIFTDQIFSIANSIGIYRQKYYVDIYRGNPNQNRRN